MKLHRSHGQLTIWNRDGLLNRDFIEFEIGIHSILVLTRSVLVRLQSMLGENSHNLAIPGLATEIPALATGANAGKKE